MQSNQIISQLIEKINSHTIEGERFEAVFAFNGKVSPVPIDKTYVAFSANGSSIDFFSDENNECCKRTKLTIAVDFYSASNRKAKDIYSLSESIMDYLMAEYAGKMLDYRTEALTIDDNLRLFRLPCKMSFVFEQCPAFATGGDTILPFADFFCKTHVNDDSRHLSEEEKSFVSQPFLSGYYVGDGDSQKRITLGFKPKALFVFEASGAGIGASDGSFCSTFAFAFANRATKGLSLSADGFIVQSESVADGVTVKLNNLGRTYCYMAF